MLNVQDFVDAHLYQSEESVIQDALRHLLRVRTELRIDLAVFRFQHEDISLAKTADLAGLRWAQMKDVLLEKGIPPRLGVDSVEELQNDIQALRDELSGKV